MHLLQLVDNVALGHTDHPLTKRNNIQNTRVVIIVRIHRFDDDHRLADAVQEVVQGVGDVVVLGYSQELVLVCRGHCCRGYDVLLSADFTYSS